MIKKNEIRVSIAYKILDWYDRNGRKLPWRNVANNFSNPYYVWVSEIMLQQTTVATVVPYFIEFINRWPSIQDLAKSELDELLHLWQGLGYYARARNLHKAARIVVSDWGSELPRTEDQLLTLPGIGDYTAAAIVAIAYNQFSIPIDGNIERIISRVFAIDEPPVKVKSKIKLNLANIMPSSRYGDFVQALMDIGATICKPKNPACSICPLVETCKAFTLDAWSKYPIKKPKKTKQKLYGVVFYLTRKNGYVLLSRRPTSGLLGGMIGLPTTEWRNKEWGKMEAESLSPIKTDLVEVVGSVKHTFTHFNLNLRVMRGNVFVPMKSNEIWKKPKDFGSLALPTLMKKVFSHVNYSSYVIKELK